MFIKQLLIYCGFPTGFRGFDMLEACICIGSQDENMLLICKRLYLEVAPLFNSNPKAMERDMRTVIDYVWEHCDHEELRKVSGCSMFYKEPSVTEVIDFFVCYVNDHAPNPKTKTSK